MSFYFKSTFKYLLHHLVAFKHYLMIVLSLLALPNALQAGPVSDYVSVPYEVYDFGEPTAPVGNILILLDSYDLNHLGRPARWYYFTKWGEMNSSVSYDTWPESTLAVFKNSLSSALPLFEGKTRIGIMTANEGDETYLSLGHRAEGGASHRNCDTTVPVGCWYNIANYTGSYHNKGNKNRSVFLNLEVDELDAGHLAKFQALLQPTEYVSDSTPGTCISPLPPGVTCTAGVYTPSSVLTSTFRDPKTDPLIHPRRSGYSGNDALDMSPNGPVVTEVIDYFQNGWPNDASIGGPASAPSTGGCLNDQNHVLYFMSGYGGQGSVWNPSRRSTAGRLDWSPDRACSLTDPNLSTYTSPFVDASQVWPFHIRYGYWEYCLADPPNDGPVLVDQLKADAIYAYDELYSTENLAYSAKRFKDNDIKFHVVTRYDDLHTNALDVVAQQGGSKKHYEILSVADAIDAFEEILLPVSAGADYSTLAELSIHITDSRGFGTSTSSRYSSMFRDDSASGVAWVGELAPLWIDRRGNLREDRGVKGKLEDCATDPVIGFYTDYTVDSGFHSRFQRYSSTGAADACVPDTSSNVGEGLISELEAIWSARDQLMQLTDAQAEAQRPFSTLASTGRHILTSFDGSTLVPFTTALSTAQKAYLAVDPNLTDGDDTPSDKIIKYIRGVEVPGLRSRTLELDGNPATKEVMRLGALIHSKPVVTGRPNAGYDTDYGDASYAEFSSDNAGRRIVTYVGGNDGLIHAFNGGFWDAASLSYKTTGANGETAHPLGTELWAYAPKNLLPHLQWLADPAYGEEGGGMEHVFYMDGSGQTFDVKLGGDWKTLLVMGMRLGGGPFVVGSETLQSAYVILDVTDPESPPQLIAEITHPQLGFTTSRPALIKSYESSSDSYTWKLIFGSGPTDLTEATSSQKAHLYTYDLATNSLSVDVINPANQGFIGDPVSVDWDRDYRDDFVYFGVNRGNDESTITGSLYRYDVNTTALSILLRNNESQKRPIVYKPIASRTPDGDRWVFVGTGRFFIPEDEDSDDVQVLFGVMEPTDADGDLTLGTRNLNQLKETSGITSYEDGSVSGAGAIETLDELRESIRDNQGGWKYTLTDFSEGPGARTLASPTLYGSEALFVVSNPNYFTWTAWDSCGTRVVIDYHSIYSLDYTVGVPGVFATLGHKSNTNADGAKEIERQHDEYYGVATSAVILSSALPSGGTSVKILTQSQRGAVNVLEEIFTPKVIRTQSWKEIPQ